MVGYLAEKGGCMDRGRLIAGLTGGLLGFITIPVLGPFAALVTLFSGFAIRNTLENLDANEPNEDSNRTTNEDKHGTDLSELLNRYQTIPGLTARSGQPGYNPFKNEIHNMTPPQPPGYVDDLLVNSIIKPSSINRKSSKKGNKQSRGKIRIDKYGYIYDPRDQPDKGGNYV
jgi:hypothetical protein